MSEQTIDILVVEDDERLGSEIVRTLEDADFTVVWKKTGSEAYYEDPEAYRLIVLDLMLPGEHGFDLLKRWRESSDVPVIILTARTDTHDKIRGFELGGDDYMTKPFWPEELVARAMARLRRPVMRRGDDSVEIGPVRIEPGARQVFVQDLEVSMTRVEFDLLAMLAKRPGQAMTRRQMVDAVLDEEREGTERTLDVHISRIRKKLGDASAHLETVWGIGYRLTETPKKKKKSS